MRAGAFCSSALVQGRFSVNALLNLEAVTAAEEVAAAGETAGAVDLLTVSQQLDMITGLLVAVVVGLGLVAGIILGTKLAQVVRELWK